MSPSDSSSSVAVIKPASPDAIAVAGVILAVCFLATGGIFVKLSPLDPIATGPGRILYLSSLGCLSTLVPLALLLEQRLVPTGLEDLVPLVGLAVLSHVVGQGMLAQCLRPVPVALSSVLVLMQPVVAAIYAWILFHETLTVRQIVGIAICLVGLYFAKRGQYDHVADDPDDVMPAPSDRDQ